MTLTGARSPVSQELDEHADSIALRMRLPWSRTLGPAFARVSTTVEGRITLHWGGYTDRPIERWHALSGAFNYRRDAHPRNELHLLFRDGGGSAFALNGGPALALGDLVLRNQVTLAEAANWGFAARLDLKLLLGSLGSAGGSGGFDAGAGLLGTFEPTGWLTLHGLLALSAWSELACTCSLQPKTWHFTAELCGGLLGRDHLPDRGSRAVAALPRRLEPRAGERRRRAALLGRIRRLAGTQPGQLRGAPRALHRLVQRGLHAGAQPAQHAEVGLEQQRSRRPPRRVLYAAVVAPCARPANESAEK